LCVKYGTALFSNRPHQPESTGKEPGFTSNEPATAPNRNPPAPAKAPARQSAQALKRPSGKQETGNHAPIYSPTRTLTFCAHHLFFARTAALFERKKMAPKKKVKIPARALKRGAMLWTEEFTTHRANKG
jgi:hypothetical protein